MIDIESEPLLSLNETALEVLPPQPSGNPISVATLVRWTTIGFRGIVLESVQCGRKRATTRKALARFFNAISEAGHQCRVPQRTYRRPEAIPERAGVELERLNV